MTIPSESIPAVIGHAGAKLKDIEKASGSQMHIIKQPDVLSSVEISGPNPASVEKAKKLTYIAVKHYLAAVSTQNSQPSYLKSDWHEAALDVRTFWAEICHNK